MADALACSDPPDPERVRRFQSLVGALLYCATMTRPDIAYAVAMLCRAMSRPTPELEVAAARVLAYLVRNRTLGLRYCPRDDPPIGYSDSDWGVRHSTSGRVFVLNQAAVSWATKKQPSVALSSCEAEIMAASEAAKDAVYIDRFSRELGITAPGADPIDLLVDNKAAIDVAYNPEHHGRVKHVERRHFFIREMVEEGRIRVPFVSTVDNCADFFTKALTGKQFFILRQRIMNLHEGSKDGSVTLRGGVEPHAESA